MRSRLVLLLFASALALAGPASAQVATNIAPDVAAGFATGTEVTRAGAVTTIAGGVQAGVNLFHSFTTFDLGAGDTARWTAPNPASVANIVNRVTGGNFSTIAGTIDTTAIPNASFYFINPAGIFFGPTAQVNVPNAAYFSTAAGGVTFADGAKFSAVTANGSSFSMTPPQSFGFLGNEGNIIVTGATANFLPNLGASLSLAASNVGIQGSNFFASHLDLVATGGQAATLAIADPLAAAPRLGQVVLSKSQIGAYETGKNSPAIRISAGSFTQIGGILDSATSFSGDAGDVVLQAQSADISGTLGSISGEKVIQGDAGNVTIDVRALHLLGDGNVTSTTIGGGAAGNVTITADTVLLEADGGGVTSESAGENAMGNAGVIQITANTLTARNGSTVSSSTDSRSGAGGAVHINANSVSLDSGFIQSSALDGSGHGGSIAIDAGMVTLSNGSLIDASTTSSGDAGSIQVRAGQLSISSSSAIDSSTLSSGMAGDVSVIADSVNVADSYIASAAVHGSSGRAGTVSVQATNLTLNNSLIQSDTSASGAAGGVAVTATNLTETNNSRISSDTFAGGAGGRVTVSAQNLSMDFSEIGSGAFQGSTGASGNLFLNVLGTLQLVNQSEISSSTFGAGDAGMVSIVAKQIALDNSYIVSTNIPTATGAAGQVMIRTGTLGLDNGSIISSDTFTRGDAGGVAIIAGKLTLANASSIESGAGTGSSGNGGTIDITADSLTLGSASVIITSTRSSGNAGQLTISGGDISLDQAALASRATGEATGTAGNIAITSSSFQVTGNGQIATSSGNPHPAGGIIIASTGLVSLIGDRSQITSENTSPTGGAAGSISISGAPILVEESGFISTNSTAGPAGDIFLFIPNSSYLELSGLNAPGVITTSSGPGTGGRIIISNPAAVISNGGQILALGQLNGANVQIRSDYFIRSSDRVNQLSVAGTLVLDSQVSDVSAGAAVPEVGFLDASGVLRGQCPAARSGGVTSQLSLRAFGPYAAQPASARPASKLRLGALDVWDHCS